MFIYNPRNAKKMRVKTWGIKRALEVSGGLRSLAKASGVSLSQISYSIHASMTPAMATRLRQACRRKWGEDICEDAMRDPKWRPNE